MKPNPPSFCYCKEPGHWKKYCYKSKYFQLSNKSFQHPPNSQWWGSKELQGLFPILPLNQLGETVLQIWDGSLLILTDTAATLSVLNPTTIKQPLPRSTNTVQTVGISNEPQEVPVPEPIPCCLGPLRDTHPFLLSSSAPIRLLGWDFLEKPHASNSRNW